VYGPVRTVVWQGSVGDRRPYADQTRVPGEVSETINGLPGLSDRVVFLERRVREFENRPR
jgi:hypothetical protein